MLLQKMDHTSFFSFHVNLRFKEGASFERFAVETAVLVIEKILTFIQSGSGKNRSAFLLFDFS